VAGFEATRDTQKGQMLDRQPYGVGVARLSANGIQRVPILEGRGWHSLLALSGDREGGTLERPGQGEGMQAGACGRASRRGTFATRPKSDWRKYLTLTAFSCIIVMEKARYMGTCRKGCMGAATRMEEAG
jgi:hypothetical protein